MILEICVDSLASAVTAERGGANRVELCSDLIEGGITPSAGLIQAVRSAISIDLFVMIRPRGGDVSYSPQEFDIMQADILHAGCLGANGVVLGMLQTDGKVDISRTAELVKLAQPMQVTFHRAIDLTPDLEAACEDVIATGAHRILTSGGMPTALSGAEQIARLVRRAGNRIRIMAGSGIHPRNAAELLQTTGATELHASLRRPVASPAGYRDRGIGLGQQKDAEFLRYELLEEDVRSLRNVMDSMRPHS